MILDIQVFGISVFSLAKVVLIMLFSVLFARGIRINMKRSFKDRIKKDHLDILTKSVYYGIILLGLLSVLPILGFNLSGILLAGGIAGLTIGFASQKIVSNLISGVFLMIERPIKVGSQVNVKDVSGYVEDISIISTIIRTYGGLYIRIPNETVFTNIITNYVANVARRIEYVVGIRYRDNADKAIEIITGLIEEHPLALENPQPTVFVNDLGDNAVNISVKIWAPATEWYGVKMELLWKIKKELEAQGIEIAFPQRVVWFANTLEKHEIEDK